MLCFYVLLVPAVMAIIAASFSWRAWIGWTSAGSSALILGLGLTLSVRTTLDAPVMALHGTLRADPLSAFMVLVIGTISLLATLFTPRTMRQEIEAGVTDVGRARHYAVLMQVFITCMLLAVLAANLGIMWVSIEATTIATTFLVGHRRTDEAFEASWKYIVLCSIGIALAFLGTVLVYYADLHVGAHHSTSLDWTSLMIVAHHLNPDVMRLAFALLVLGYGTKVGLVPMHSWLPDAHSQTPAPISALMSGVLLTVAFYALLRFRAIAEMALGAEFPRTLFLVVGLASLLLATALLIAQRDLKRMLAYSSIEHMGLLALGAAAGTPLAIGAVLLHILGHGITKSVLFLSSGEIAHNEGTTEIAKITGLLTRRPVLGGIFGFGLLALVGFPPFSIFVSELSMARAEVDVGLWWAVAISLVCLGVIFGAIGMHARQMLLGEPLVATTPVSTARSVAIPLVGALVTCALIGVLAWPLQSLLHSAAHVVAR
jgi:hydrogenase-4 component F